MNITKHQLIELTKEQIEDYKADGMDVVAFQLVTIEYSFYGRTMSDTFDTKIDSEGRQFIVSGNGFFEDGKEI